jgi:hypothetical protein
MSLIKNKKLKKCKLCGDYDLMSFDKEVCTDCEEFEKKRREDILKVN